MNASIILVAYHGDRWLPACISSLQDASLKRLHLILVDNGGNAELDTLFLNKYEAEVLQTPRPMGFAEANNYALVSASRLDEIVLFLNQDTVSPVGWIDRCLVELGAKNRLGAVSPLIRTYEDTGWDPSFLACLTEQQRGILTEPDEMGESFIETQTVPAPALLVRTDILRQVGPFDPLYGSYYEDYDLCRRIRQAGYAVGFCAEARLRHFSGSVTNTPRRERERMRQLIRNRVIYNVRDPEKPRGRTLLSYFTRDFPRRFLRGLWGTPSSQPPGVTLQAYGDVLQIARRLASHERDTAAWQAYLDELSWPDNMPVSQESKTVVNT